MGDAGFLEVDGGRLAWASDGEGPALLLVHAGVADQRMWDPLVALLAGEQRVVRVDLRGFGRSSSCAGSFSAVADLVALLDLLGVERATVVGASFGGRVALCLAAEAPERVAALVLLAPAIGEHAWSQAVQAFGDAEDAALERGDLDLAVELNLRMWVDGPARAPDQSDPGIRALVADMQRTAFELQLADESDYELGAPELAAVRAPTLVIVGGRDVPDFAAIAERLARELPGAELHRIPAAGHLLALEQPEIVAAQITAFAPRP